MNSPLTTTPSAPNQPPSLTKTLLSRAHSPTSTTRILAEKIKHKPLLLRPTTAPAATADARAFRRARRAEAETSRRRRPRPLTAKEKRQLCIYELPKAERRWEVYVGLHRLWGGYMREVLGIVEGGAKEEGGEVRRRGVHVTAAAAGPLVASADLHGALVEVVRSRCVERVGLRGFVVRDSKFVFEIVTRENQVKTIPKEHTVFRIEVPLDDAATPVDLERTAAKDAKDRLVFELHGQHFRNRAPERATKKIKMRGRDLQDL